MQLGIFAKTFAGTDPQAVLSAARQAGYQVVQYNMACSGLPSLPAEITEEQAIGVAKAAQITGVAIAAISATYNMTHPDEEQRRRLVYRAQSEPEKRGQSKGIGAIDNQQMARIARLTGLAREGRNGEGALHRSDKHGQADRNEQADRNNGLGRAVNEPSRG